MGIRFNCPNGHKLHVKDFLAGKKGICPKCGVKVDIPGEVGSLAPGPPKVVTSTRQASTAQDGSTATVAKPNDAWYVRISTGQQFGPASDSEFREWIRQGRVGPDCMVWQEGWSDWRSWPAVQSEFLAPQSSPGPPPLTAPAVPTPPIAPAPPTAPAVTTPPLAADNGNDNRAELAATSQDAVQIETDRPLPKRRSHMLVYLLIGICVCLLPILIYVVTQS